MKTLISWCAYNNDFTEEPGQPRKVNELGPTFEFHRLHFEGYDRHVLLSSTDPTKSDLRLEHLKTALKKAFPTHLVETRLMGIPQESVIDPSVIRAKVEPLLLEFRADELDLFISPGTPAMQVAWYLCHLGLGLRTRLLQTRPPRFGKPQLVEVQMEQSTVPVSVILAEKIVNEPEQGDGYQLTEALKPIYAKARLAAQVDKVTCLVRGEHGTGKEHLARYIHEQSPRKNRPFIVVNCSALGENLLESRLFGYKKGAFTGAEKDAEGLFKAANGGTLFMDEIGDVSAYTQQSLLRVLQDGDILPVGSTGTETVNVRIIAATNRDLEEMAERGAFRWDLYYRLAVVELTLPRLSERGEGEVSELLDYFTKKIPAELGRKRPLKFSKEARKALLSYPYRGNVRELENLVRQLAVFTQDLVKAEDLPAKVRSPHSEGGIESFLWREHEKALIIKTLAYFKGNQSKTCEAIGYGSVNTFKKRLKDYNIVS